MKKHKSKKDSLKGKTDKKKSVVKSNQNNSTEESKESTGLPEIDFKKLMGCGG